jgi:hypothetical protein
VGLQRSKEKKMLSWLKNAKIKIKIKIKIKKARHRVGVKFQGGRLMPKGRKIAEASAKSLA